MTVRSTYGFGCCSFGSSMLQPTDGPPNDRDDDPGNPNVNFTGTRRSSEASRWRSAWAAAYRANVPIFCPAIADSSIGMGLSQARQKTAGTGYIDIIGDIVESANLVIRRPRTLAPGMLT